MLSLRTQCDQRGGTDRPVTLLRGSDTMSDIVVESLGAGGTMHIMHSSAQMGCFLLFALVCVLSAMAETAYAKTHGRGRKGREDLGDLPLTSTSVAMEREQLLSDVSGKKVETETVDVHHAAPATASDHPMEPKIKSSAPISESQSSFDPHQLKNLSPIRIALGDKQALLNSRQTLRNWAEFGLVLGLFYFADRSGAIPDSEKSYDRDLFLFLFFALAAYGWQTSLQKSKTHAPLNREQTEEWKGWMQVLFLLYHYFKASEAYNAIRLFIAAYVWMTGFGNFSYYYVRKDFSAPRFWQMMWRLNFFVTFTCITLRNDYTLYYICPMHTLFTLFVYFSLLIYKEGNDKVGVLGLKCLICTFLVYVLWEVPGVFGVVFYPFRWLLKYTDPVKPDVDPMHEWFFRSGLDRYVWIYGMICAFCHPRYEAFLKWVDEKPYAVRISIQSIIGVTTCAILTWYYKTYYVLPKLEYNKVHPYTSWIPITCFIILRNLTQSLRNFYVSLFCVCGKITLETYISQFHIWLSTSNVPNGQPGKLMSLVPEYPLLNFGIATIAYVGISHRVFHLTNELKTACVPNDIGFIKAHFVCGVSIALVATVVGFLVVHVVMAEPVL